MKLRAPGFHGRYIVVADEDRAVVSLVVETLLDDGHAVFHAYDGLSAVQLALGLKVCDLVITNTRVGGMMGLDLIHDLRIRLPKLPILFLDKPSRPEPESAESLPRDVPVLSEPFTPEELRAAVRYLLEE